MEISKEDLFSENMPSHIIKGFPYPERFCKYCEQPLTIWKAFHVQGCMEMFKVAYICLNHDCPAYDEDEREAYLRVYYSSPEAYDILSTKLMTDPRDIATELRKQ